MSHPFRARALVAVVGLVAAGCQDYNFNPVGHCVIQPGGQQFTLSSVSTADVLFVVDDSGSMGGEQQRLADAFGDFVQNLTSTNVARNDAGLVPIDFHVAVTTTSIYWNSETTQTCTSTWAGSTGPTDLACAIGTTPVKMPRTCSTEGTAAPQCPVANTACRYTCNGLKGSLFCCAADGSFPPAAIDQIVKCKREGIACGKLDTHYAFDTSCRAGTGVGSAEDQFPFPDGDFVSLANTVARIANPRVLHFDKRLYTAIDEKNSQGFTRAQLEGFFKENVKVGICGSGQEQGLEAAYRALARALHPDALLPVQKDTWTYANLDADTVGTASRSYSVAPGRRVAGAPSVWPNSNSKLVLVFVGDEDDCSATVQDPSASVVMVGDPAGADACTRDATEVLPLGKKQKAVSDFVSYFTTQGRPVAAAFITSARSQSSESSCTGDACFAAKCVDPTCTAGADVCGGQAPGTRFIEAARQLKVQGGDVVVGSICDDFAPLLNQVAEIVKPPETLSLPTEPAESRITLLRIVSANGESRLCGAPLDPAALGSIANPTLQDAVATGADWWFTASAQPGPPVAVSKFVYINNKTGTCRANPGETYSVDYLGVVPAGGCVVMPEDHVGGDPAAPLFQSVDCASKLGGRATDLQCFVPPGLTRGTCTCRAGN
ncbi:MAG TPA: hypothetical protein VF912_15650 [Anaeromyxobacter sp.]